MMSVFDSVAYKNAIANGLGIPAHLPPNAMQLANAIIRESVSLLEDIKLYLACNPTNSIEKELLENYKKQIIEIARKLKDEWDII